MPGEEALVKEIVRRPSEARKLEPAKLERLLEEARQLLRSEPALLEVEGGSVLFVGDTHGDLESSIKAFSVGADKYVFLGDYVDRGPYQVENVLFLLAKKILDPERVFLLRGNHESPLANVHYGFLDDVMLSFGRDAYDAFVSVFSVMPYAALVNGDVFAVHGGLANGLRKISQARELPRPDEVPQDPIAFELLWNDPSEEVRGFAPGPRGPGTYLFGRDVFESFARDNGLRLMVRAHEYFPGGVFFYFGGKVISVFSCRYYPAALPKGLLLTPRGYEAVPLM